MKSGDLVRIPKRGQEIFIVLSRADLPLHRNHEDDSVFSEWIILNTLTGKLFYQIKRTLEVISENR